MKFFINGLASFSIESNKYANTNILKLTNKSKVRPVTRLNIIKYKGKFEKPIDFDKPFYQAEEHLELYNSNTDSVYGGDSKYIRLSKKQAKEIKVFGKLK